MKNFFWIFFAFLGVVLFGTAINPSQRFIREVEKQTPRLFAILPKKEDLPSPEETEERVIKTKPGKHGNQNRKFPGKYIPPTILSV